MLGAIAKKEGYKIDKPSLALLALIGEGSFRDAIGSLQKVLDISKDKNLTVDEIEVVTGAPRVEIVHELIEGGLLGKSERVLKAIDNAVTQDVDIKLLTKLVMKSLRQAMLLLYAPVMEKEISEEVSKEELEFLKKIKNSPNAKLLPAYLKELLVSYNQIDRSYIKQLPLEIAALNVVEKGDES